GARLSGLMWAHPDDYFPEVAKLALHQPNHIPFEVWGDGSGTGAMCAFTAVMYFFIGPNLTGGCLALGASACAGQILLYRCAREAVEEREREPLLYALFLTPSVIFWSSGTVKESFAFSFLCLLCYGLFGLFARRQPLSVVWIVVGSVGVG